MKRQTVGLLIFCALFLLACGEETVSERILNNSISVVSSIAELPECGKSNDGEQVLVKEESSVRVCSGGKWFAVVGDTVYLQDESFACYAEKLLDGSGTKILCNGDSVGVVLNGENGANGEDGADGKKGPRGIRGEQGDDGEPGLRGVKGDSGAVGDVGKNGIGCSIKEIDEVSVRVVCAADSTTLYIGDAPMELDSEKVAVSLDEVSGASQKGPYLSGSKVSAYEISDGRTLKQTGNVFSGKIANDKGEFRINSRSLVSQYLSLEATGYYRNEVTGKNSDAELTLRAITDVSERSVVNVNLLTHLEYERVNYLVTKEKMKVWAAKKQAQNEIFGMMFINAEDFDNSEDLNIAGSSDEDAALLAFSILLQGDRSVSQLSELLTKIAKDMEEDGIWDGYSAKDSIVKWALSADTSGLLDSIRKNVLSWGLSAMVPNFEKYIRHFWYVGYGLEECNRDSVGIIRWSQWICKDVDEPNEDYRWVIASYLEQNIYQWEPGEDGEIRLGNISDASDNKYIYDGELGQWRSTTAFEDDLGACVESIENDDSKNTGYFDCGASSVSQYKTERDCRYIDGYNLDGDWVYWERGWYRCIDRKWTPTTALYVDTRNWKPGNDADVVKGDSSDAFYVYDELESVWHKANEQDSTLGLNGCTTKRTGEIQKSAKDGEYYGCASDHRWLVIPEKVIANTNGYECVEGTMQPGKDDSNIHFVCELGLWREATVEEEQLGEMMVCTAANEGAFTKDSSKICKRYPWSWKEEYRLRGVCLYDFDVYPNHFFNPELEYGELYDNRDGRTYRTIEINGITVMAENLNYAGGSEYRYLIDNNKCYDNDSINCLKGGRLYTWSAAMNVDPKWNFSSTGLADGLIENPHRGICPEGWHIPTVEEWAALIDGYVVTVGYHEYDLGGLYASGGFHIYDELVATNTSGLTILPSATNGGGFDGYYGGYYPEFWSTSTDNMDEPISFVVDYITYEVLYYGNMVGSVAGYKNVARYNPVRCMKDSE